MSRPSSRRGASVLAADVAPRPQVCGQRLRVEPSLMIALGLVLLLVGFVLTIPILWTLGIILLVVGLLFALLGASGRAVGGRRHYY